MFALTCRRHTFTAAVLAVGWLAVPIAVRAGPPSHEAVVEVPRGVLGHINEFSQDQALFYRGWRYRNRKAAKGMRYRQLEQFEYPWNAASDG